MALLPITGTLPAFSKKEEAVCDLFDEAFAATGVLVA
jgi:hypothetical protein